MGKRKHKPEGGALLKAFALDAALLNKGTQNTFNFSIIAISFAGPYFN